MTIKTALATAAGLLLAAPAVFAFEETPYLFAPRPLAYTAFNAAPATEVARHYAALYANEPELADPANAGGAFEAHVQIERPGFTQEFSIFFTKRLCRPLDAAIPAVSRCPARLIAYRAGAPVETIINNICVVAINDAPPSPADAGRTGANITVRTGAEPTLVVSALLNGEQLRQCTRAIPLGPGKDIAQ